MNSALMTTPADADDHLSDAELAVQAAAGAGRLLLEIRASSGLYGPALGRVGDRAAHEWIAGVVKGRRREDVLLSEEGGRESGRLQHSRVWVVDPLDGTREYAEGRTDFAVHVCLVTDSEPAASAVCLPALDRTYSSAAPQALPPPTAGTIRIAISRSRPPAVAARVADSLGARLVPMGSAGAKAMAVLRGEVDAYLHAGGQYEWDTAAPAGVALAAGLHASRIDGAPLRYNRPDPYLPDVLICQPHLAADLLAAIARETRESHRGDC